ncbi:MAG: integral rane sensor signal transduction histidine kinase [Bryobacterales bacterium]|nr:integral rane sensor signal transduction histidine kinase [Bryobacterales bacterium]
MTLRARLLLLTFAMVAIVAVTLILVNLDSLARASLDAAVANSEMGSRQIQSVIMRRLSSAQSGGVNFEETRDMWNRMVAADHDLTALLEQTMVQSGSIVEINIANQTGVILASSNPGRRGSVLIPRVSLQELRESGPARRMAGILRGSADYETVVPLGIPGHDQVLMRIQTLISPVLLRAATYPALINLGLTSGIALGLAFLLAWWSANVALRPLARIGHLIDDIVSGDAMPVLLPQKPEVTEGARELAVVESKLTVLGERFRDAQLDAFELRTNLEGALEKLDAGSRRQVEEQIAIAKRLTAINSLTGRVAHEIKNPLNSIALRLEILRGHIEDELPEAAPEIAVLAEEVTRLDRVVRTFLDFNRPVELSFEDTDMGHMISGLQEFLGPEAKQRHISCVVQLPAEPLIVRADATLLRQAFLNIALNAIEAMPNGGELRFQVTREANTCVVRFIDNGPGIPKEHQEKIFQLYYTTKVRGSGIGLAMSFRAMQIHSGTIQVKSEVGQGTEFTIQLPLSSAR